MFFHRCKNISVVVLLVAFGSFASNVLAQEHLISLELTFEGATTCPVNSPVVISAVDCDAATIADEIENSLIDAGLDSGPFTPFCALATGGTFAGWYQCIWNVPNGCEQTEERATVQRGAVCGDNRLAGMVIEPTNFSGAFFFRVFP